MPLVMAKYPKKKIFGIVAIIFGILVVINTRLLAYVVGLYLVISGILTLLEE